MCYAKTMLTVSNKYILDAFNIPCMDAYKKKSKEFRATTKNIKNRGITRGLYSYENVFQPQIPPQCTTMFYNVGVHYISRTVLET